MASESAEAAARRRLETAREALLVEEAAAARRVDEVPRPAAVEASCSAAVADGGSGAARAQADAERTRSRAEQEGRRARALAVWEEAKADVERAVARLTELAPDAGPAEQAEPTEQADVQWAALPPEERRKAARLAKREAEKEALFQAARERIEARRIEQAAAAVAEEEAARLEAKAQRAKDYYDRRFDERNKAARSLDPEHMHTVVAMLGPSQKVARGTEIATKSAAKKQTALAAATRAAEAAERKRAAEEKAAKRAEVERAKDEAKRAAAEAERAAAMEEWHELHYEAIEAQARRQRAEEERVAAANELRERNAAQAHAALQAASAKRSEEESRQKRTRAVGKERENLKALWRERRERAHTARSGQSSSRLGLSSARSATSSMASAQANVGTLGLH